MNNFAAAIQEIREERGMTQRELADLTGIDQSLLSRRFSGQVRIKLNELPIFAKALGVTVDEIRKRAAPTNIERSRGPGIPVINRAPAGEIIDYEEFGVDSGQGYEYLDWDSVKDELAFAVVVIGDSMEPVLYDGDRAVFSPVLPNRRQPKLDDGAIVFVRFGPMAPKTGCTIARFFREPDGRARLSKDNPRYPPIYVPMDQESVVDRIAVCIERRTRRL